jgi:hypothetical protein
MSGIVTIDHGFAAMHGRPAMYLSPVSVSALHNFLEGYSLGRGSVSPEANNAFRLPPDFHDWVAYRLHFFGSCAGWHNMIIERFGDGPEGLEQFFALLDQHQSRLPKIVATLAGSGKTYTTFSMSGEERSQRLPPVVRLISYGADDPGLFVIAEGFSHFPWGTAFCPSLSCFEEWAGPCQSELIVQDEAAFLRWAKHQPTG